MLEKLIILLPVILPMIFWAGYHYYKDHHLPEPWQNLVFCLVLGCASFYIGKYGYIALGFVNLRFDAFYLAETDSVALLLYSLLAIGPIEELSKFIPFILLVTRFKAFDEPIDGIIYASFIALGFAALENIQYLAYSTTGESIARGIAGPLVHIMFASIWGYHVGKAMLKGSSLWIAAGVSVILASLMHGLYDFIVIGYAAEYLAVSSGIILVIWIWRLRLIKDLHRRYKDTATQ